MPIKHWTMSSELITQEAFKLDYKVDILNKDKNLYVIYKNNKPFFFKSSATMGNNMAGNRIAGDKNLLFDVLDKFIPECPKPKSINIKQSDDVTLKLQKNTINYPLVVKPVAGAHGNDVMMNIINEKQLTLKLNTLFKKYSDVIIQEMLSGNDYRILTIGYKVKAVIKKIPAFIIGNGQLNIEKLVKLKNQLNKSLYKSLSDIILNEETDTLLQNFNNMNIKSIPTVGEKIYLKQTANLSAGGIGIDCTNEINPKTITLAEQLSELLEMNLLGIDIITDNISKPLTKNSGLIEVNSCPGVRMHHFPHEGKPRNVAREILKAL